MVENSWGGVWRDLVFTNPLLKMILNFGMGYLLNVTIYFK